MDSCSRLTRLSWPILVLAMVCGCASGPLLDNPMVLRPDPNINVENPLYIPLGPPSYGLVFEKVLDVITDYFEVSYANRYDGRIVTYPRIAPGLEQPWKPGSPDFSQRLEATLQTLRHRLENETSRRTAEARTQQPCAANHHE